MSDTQSVESGILERFIANYWGYGRFEAPLWIVGMEESCGKGDFAKRINTWHRRGENQLDDAAGYHEEIRAEKLFKAGARLQRTWSKLIKIYLAAYGHETNVGKTRQFQIETLGRRTPTVIPTCFIELMPLPSPSTKDWWVKDFTNLAYLQERGAYMKEVEPERTKKLKALVAKYRPKAVVFYGATYQRYWQGISGTLERHPQHEKMHHAKVDGTTFVMMPHPVSHGVRNADFIEAGKLLRDQIGGNDGIAPPSA